MRLAYQQVLGGAGSTGRGRGSGPGRGGASLESNQRYHIEFDVRFCRPRRDMDAEALSYRRLSLVDDVAHAGVTHALLLRLVDVRERHPVRIARVHEYKDE
jgi:hypothetical protein